MATDPPVGTPEKSNPVAAVIEDDSTMVVATGKALASCGFANTESFSAGNQAWPRLLEAEFDLIILDWKLSEVTGLTLLNRLRKLPRHTFTPVLIVSGYLNSQDFRLIEEFPFTTSLEKPFALPLFQYKVKELLAHSSWFRERKVTIEQTFADLAASANEGSDALRAIQDILRTTSKPLPLVLAAARAAVTRQHLADAESLLKDYLKTDPECPSALTLLGKVLLLQHRPDDALKALTSAQAHSPSNLERLCLIGDANLHGLSPDLAAQAFDSALALDSEDVKATAGKGLAVSMASYLSLPSTTSIPSSFAGLLNAVGISFVRSKRVDEGIRYYEQAMSYVEDNLLRSKLSFNIGLGHIRNHHPEQAAHWFRQAVALSGGSLPKATEYLRKLDPDNAPDDVVVIGSASSDSKPALNWEDDDYSKASLSAAADAPSISASSDDELAEESIAARPQLAQLGPLFDRLKSTIVAMTTAEPSLFASTGREDLRRSCEAFSGTFGGHEICVFVPKAYRPAEIKDMDEATTRRSQILVLHEVAEKWQVLWPTDDDQPVANRAS